MSDWWHRNIIEPGKLPLLLCLFAFVVTFLLVRVVTRMIRAGKGPFGNVSTGGLHVHHAVPGLILTIASGLIIISPLGHSPWLEIAAAIFGTGAGLVMDEFALILYLQDVYWTDEGRRSVEAVVITTAIIGLVLIGVLPYNVNNVDSEESDARLVVISHIVINFLFLVIVLAKGKLGVALVGLFIPTVAFIGALRLANPKSPWAHWRYRTRPGLARKATERFVRYESRWWRRLVLKLQNMVAGAPTQ